MRIGFCLAILLLSAAPAHAQDALSFGRPITRDINVGETHTYTFAAAAGEVAGPIELVGPEAIVQFLDGAGRAVSGARINRFPLSGTSRTAGRVRRPGLGHLSGSDHRHWRPARHLYAATGQADRRRAHARRVAHSESGEYQRADPAT